MGVSMFGNDMSKNIEKEVYAQGRCGVCVENIGEMKGQGNL
jgi:hypothetical protein